jgi:predicted transglutaminase-like cysteine proteinase
VNDLSKTKVIFPILAVLALALLIMPASARPASGMSSSSMYSIDRDHYRVLVSGPNSIQVNGYNHDDTALYLGDRKGAMRAARDVITLAQRNQMKVRRTQSDIMEEINTHAVMHLMGEDVHSLPVDIGVNEWNGVWIADGSLKMLKKGGKLFVRTMTTQPVY